MCSKDNWIILFQFIITLSFHFNSSSFKPLIDKHFMMTNILKKIKSNIFGMVFYVLGSVLSLNVFIIIINKLFVQNWANLSYPRYLTFDTFDSV